MAWQRHVSRKEKFHLDYTPCDDPECFWVDKESGKKSPRRARWVTAYYVEKSLEAIHSAKRWFLNRGWCDHHKRQILEAKRVEISKAKAAGEEPPELPEFFRLGDWKRDGKVVEQGAVSFLREEQRKWDKANPELAAERERKVAERKAKAKDRHQSVASRLGALAAKARAKAQTASAPQAKPDFLEEEDEKVEVEAPDFLEEEDDEEPASAPKAKRERKPSKAELEAKAELDRGLFSGRPSPVLAAMLGEMVNENKKEEKSSPFEMPKKCTRKATLADLEDL